MSDDEVFEEASAVIMNGAAAAARAAEAVARRRQNTDRRTAKSVDLEADELRQRTEVQAAGAERWYAARGDERWVRTARSKDVAGTWRGVHTWAELDSERFAPHADRINQSVMAAVGRDPRAAIAAAGVGVDDSGPVLVDLLDRSRAAQERIRASEQQEASESARADQDRDLAQADVVSDPEEAEADAAERGGVAQATSAEADVSDAAAEISEDLAYDSPERRSATTTALSDAGVSDQAVAAKMTADHLNGQNPRRGAAFAKAATQRPARSRTKTTKRGRENDLSR